MSEINSERSGFGTFLLFFLPVVFVAILIAIIKGPDPVKVYEDEKMRAYSACTTYVKTILKAPASAVFPDTYTSAKRRSGLFIITGYVDAQNSFGAMLRNGFECTVGIDNDRWKLVDFRMEGKHQE